MNLNSYKNVYSNMLPGSMKKLRQDLEKIQQQVTNISDYDLIYENKQQIQVDRRGQDYLGNALTQLPTLNKNKQASFTEYIQHNQSPEVTNYSNVSAPPMCRHGTRIDLADQDISYQEHQLKKHKKKKHRKNVFQQPNVKSIEKSDDPDNIFSQEES